MACLATVTIQSDTGVPTDAVVNTFAINQYTPSTATSTENQNVALAFVNFYVSSPGGTTRTGSALTGSISSYLSPVLNNSAGMMTVRLYDIPAPGNLMGSPAYTMTQTLIASALSSPTPIPSEVALAVTLEAGGRENAAVELGNGTRPKSRYTGRIYIGPLNNHAVTTLNGVARPATLFADVCINAVNALDQAIRTVNVAADLAVWSRVDGLVRAVRAVSVDDSFDIQRRRGEKPSLRRRVLLTED